MKPVKSLVIILVLIFALTACGKTPPEIPEGDRPDMPNNNAPQEVSNEFIKKDGGNIMIKKHITKTKYISPNRLTFSKALFV